MLTKTDFNAGQNAQWTTVARLSIHRN